MSKEKHEQLTGRPSIGYWDLELEASTSFNRLKGKIFNLVEASIPDKIQQEALKGLIRGFANDEFGILCSNMRYTARLAKFIEEGEDSEIPPMSANPLGAD